MNRLGNAHTEETALPTDAYLHKFHSKHFYFSLFNLFKQSVAKPLFLVTFWFLVKKQTYHVITSLLLIIRALTCAVIAAFFGHAVLTTVTHQRRRHFE